MNLGGLRLMLERCRALGTRPKFLYASSTAAFGPNDLVDDHTPTRPMSSYGHQKAMGEYYGRAAHRITRLLALPASRALAAPAV